jgi:hypothetical protein
VNLLGPTRQDREDIVLGLCGRLDDEFAQSFLRSTKDVYRLL